MNLARKKKPLPPKGKGRCEDNNSLAAGYFADDLAGSGAKTAGSLTL
jgi:hypothetical protein